MALGGAVPTADPEEILGAWEDGRAGGLCFDVTQMLGSLLEALQYDVFPVLGQISFPGSHHGLVVLLARRRFLVDVSCGAPLQDPIALDSDCQVGAVGLSYRFRAERTPDIWVQERAAGDTWSPFCRYDLRPATPAERHRAYQRHHAPAETWVTSANRDFKRCFPPAGIVCTVPQTGNRAPQSAESPGIPGLTESLIIPSLRL
jgi:arylamine N-acetyltransferase